MEKNGKKNILRDCWARMPNVFCMGAMRGWEVTAAVAE